MKKKRTLPNLLGTATFAALIASTGMSGSAPLPRTENLASLGTSQGSEERTSNLIAEVHQAERNSLGNLLSVTWSIENKGNDRIVLTWLTGQSYTYSGANFSGVTATSENGETRHHPAMDGLGNCLCSGNSSGNFKERLEPGEKVAYWSLFSVPEDVETVTVEIPNFDPIEDIPIS